MKSSQMQLSQPFAMQFMSVQVALSNILPGITVFCMTVHPHRLHAHFSLLARAITNEVLLLRTLLALEGFLSLKLFRIQWHHENPR